MEKKELIFKIKRNIMNYELKMNSYKTSELECLEKIPSIYDYMVSLNEFKKIDLIYAGIILGDKYDDFELIKCLPEDLIKIINEFDFDKFEVIYLLEDNDLKEKIEKFSEQYSSDSVDNIKKVCKMLRLINKEDFMIISDFFRCTGFTIGMKRIYSMNDCSEENLKEERDILLEVNSFPEFFDRIETKKKEIKLENKRLNKLYSDKIKKLNRLINNLEKGKNGEEITNIDELLDYAGEEFRHDILIYIKENNKSYNEKLERKYLNLKKNSISKFINIFGKNNIDFMLFNDAEKKIIMSRGYDSVEKIIKFLNKIDYKFKNEILLIIAGTNNDIISKIEEFIKKIILIVSL